jgi:hypothetical protein
MYGIGTVIWRLDYASGIGLEFSNPIYAERD